MRSGEVGDEEASAVSAVLSILRETWDHSLFTAREVVKAMTSPARGWSPLAPTGFEDADIKRAEAIADALGELVGRRLDRPTAHSIGKLFQKRLVGRPAWIGDGQTVAVLRKFPGHSENTYRIEVVAAGQSQRTTSEKTSAAGDPGKEHPPHSPHSPTWRPGDGLSGKGGKDGKVFAETAAGEVNLAYAAAPRGWRRGI
jgi:hypothetical protein